MWDSVVLIQLTVNIGLLNENENENVAKERFKEQNNGCARVF